MPKKRVTYPVFLDRDGVINEERSFISRVVDFRLLPLSLAAIRKLTAGGCQVFVISNQSGIARGLIELSIVEEIHRLLLKKAVEAGGNILKIYYCPHGPDDGCECRKPLPGMIYQARDDFGISLEDGWMVGDSDVDILAGKAAGLKTILLPRRDVISTVEPDFWAKTLMDAVEIILGE